ncbi:hypothetical protein B0T25DRAFT_523430 [Lasiosphaeria hispida]|uniref:Ankyrin n=1 Tax=Lasiosphaeria hispida TaxID=260671 RepID=A0AAJ0M7Q0_9PEZI|nr:hypothetical protein B0T25DRAFT_523430 [Lasiosphaeria hispida]
MPKPVKKRHFTRYNTETFERPSNPTVDALSHPRTLRPKPSQQHLRSPIWLHNHVKIARCATSKPHSRPRPNLETTLALLRQAVPHPFTEPLLGSGAAAVDTLLEAGAGRDVNKTNKAGMTPFHNLLDQRHIQSPQFNAHFTYISSFLDQGPSDDLSVVKLAMDLLLAHGANGWLQDPSGKCAMLEWVKQSAKNEVLQPLLRGGWRRLEKDPLVMRGGSEMLGGEEELLGMYFLM